MDKKSVEAKHKIVIVGGSYKVDKDMIAEYALEGNRRSVLLNTGKIIGDVVRDMVLPDLGNLSLIEYHRFVEPAVISTIRNHLTYSDVVLNTVYHYLVPGMSTRALRRMSDKISTAKLVLVTEDPKRVMGRDYAQQNTWYREIGNITEDMRCNEDYFDIYRDVLIRCNVPVEALKVDVGDPKAESAVKKFLKQVIK
jgi:hypothetical protein